jgi:hypothetical protein
VYSQADTQTWSALCSFYAHFAKYKNIPYRQKENKQVVYESLLYTTKCGGVEYSNSIETKYREEGGSLKFKVNSLRSLVETTVKSMK